MIKLPTILIVIIVLSVIVTPPSTPDTKVLYPSGDSTGEELAERDGSEKFGAKDLEFLMKTMKFNDDWSRYLDLIASPFYDTINNNNNG